MDGDAESSLDDRLQAIPSVTDVGTGRLDLDDVLREQMARVAEFLHADTATVLLLSDRGGQLVVRAAHGIEEEVRQGVKVPVGQGFAGRVAVERRPATIDDFDPVNLWSPIPGEKGMRRMLAVPLEAGLRLIGVLEIGRLTDRDFTSDDETILQLVATRVAAEVQSHHLAMERAAGRIVQLSLLPSALPQCPGIEFATRFVPTAEGGVGGDWYDAFVVASGDLWVMAGDVEGHGLEAAIFMGRLRAALRAYALIGETPGRVLTLADRKFQFFDPGRMATVVCARLSSPYNEIQMATAGHLPPVLARPGESAELIDIVPGPPLGAADIEPDNLTLALPKGALLMLYTDGLVERRDQSLDAGLDRLKRVVSANDPELVCRSVMSALVGEAVPDDDIAVLALRRSA